MDGTGRPPAATMTGPGPATVADSAAAAAAEPGAGGAVARRIAVDGTVQGVGFRPYVWRLATELRLDGVVRNRAGRVEIDVYGPLAAVHALVARLGQEAPALARVEAVTVDPLSDPPPAGGGFVVGESHDGPTPERLFPPDLGICPACTAELFDPGDRRHRYPFINCTDCGPRATIIDSLPYDRPRTTMADFPLCPDCLAEYRDPADRRFHAEPVACAACGPTLCWHAEGCTGQHGDGPHGEAALRAAVAVLAGGGIVAVKGLGGYHLACDATDEAAVRRLRERKHRAAKPLAVMVADLAAARRIGRLTPEHERLLTGPERPIVLVDQVPAAATAPAVCAGVRQVGLFLPYTGLHHLLLADLGRPIVLTSGNRSDEPIAVDDAEAVARLGDITDGFLAHDRRIRSRYEDSVVAVVGGGPVLLRRGRGYAPRPLRLPVPAPEPVLAVGAQLKHTFTVAALGRAHLAGHTGDLEDLATLEAFAGNREHLCRLLELDPGWVAHDLHPGYLSTQQAVADFPAERRIGVQHHHAHVAACLAEHGLTGPAVGVALDGLGLGGDGTLWGGEVLVADLVGYRRVGRFGRAPMPGGAAAVHQPWRMALGYLLGAEDDTGATGAGGVVGAGDAAGSGGVTGDPGALLDRLDPAAVRVVTRQIATGVNTPVASSAGRLFDAASAILGICHTAAYEGQAAILLEQAAMEDAAAGRAGGDRGHLPVRVVSRDGTWIFDPRPTLAGLLAGVRDGVPVATLAARFQRAVAQAVAELAGRAAAEARLDLVCLSGGVFANAWLLVQVPRLLRDAGLTVLTPRAVPAGDGGISFGQAAVAAARLAAGSPHGQEDRHVPWDTWSGHRDLG